MEQDKTRSSEEIDLLYFFNPVIVLIRKLFRALGIYLSVLWRNAWLFVSILLAGAVVSFCLRFFLPKYFVTSAVFVSHYMPATVSLSALEELNVYASGSNTQKNLAQRLKLDESVAAAIHGVSAETVDGADYKYKHDTTAGAAFRVTLRLASMDGIDEIQEHLRIHLENNDYSVSRKKARMKTLDIIKTNLLEKEKSLDSLKILMRDRMTEGSKSQVVIMNQTDIPLEIYNMEQENARKIALIEQELDELENIEVVQPFARPVNYNYPDFKKIVKNGLLITLLVALVLTPLLGRRK